MSKRKEPGMDKRGLTHEEFLNLVDIFMTLKRWRDERNEALMHEELEREIELRMKELEGMLG